MQLSHDLGPQSSAFTLKPTCQGDREYPFLVLSTLQPCFPNEIEIRRTTRLLAVFKCGRTRSRTLTLNLLLHLCTILATHRAR
jgi:hypothetical protein